MPSWTDNLQQDHRWTGRQLISIDDQTDDEVQSSMTRPRTAERSSGNTARRILIDDDALSDDDREMDDFACDMAASSPPSIASTWSIPHCQSRVGKRTLLTAEEMEDSEDGFDEQEEEDDMGPQSTEPTNPFQQLAISVPSFGEDMMMEDTGEDGRIAMSRRDFDSGRGSDENMQQVETTFGHPSKSEADLDMHTHSNQDAVDETIQHRELSPETPSGDRNEDSGRVQESQEQEDEPLFNQVIAMKRK